MLEEFKKKQSVKLGLAPTRRNLSRKNFFDKADAKVEKDIVEVMLEEKGIEYVNLDFLNEEGIICNGLDAEAAAKYFVDEKVDAIFAPHCNFGTEDAIAKLAKLVDKPLLIWGPRDDAPLADGSRLRDSQCGLFATSKVLQQFGITYSYIPNCRVEDPIFVEGFADFMAAVATVKAFKNARIGQIGVRPAAFWTVKCNEEELLNKFGIEVVPISIADLKIMMDRVMAEEPERIMETKEEMKAKVDVVTLNEDEMDLLAAMKIAILDWARIEKLDAAAMLCTGAARAMLKICQCFVMADLTDDGFPVACETDIHGALTSLMVQAAVQGRTATFLADMTIRHPQNDNGELLWHCGVFPNSLKKPGCTSKINDHYGAKVPGVAEWEIKGGDITICRFDGVNGKYKLLFSEGKGIEGPANKGTYMWAEFKDWLKLEKRLIDGPYIHHCTGVHEKISGALYEACRYISGLEADPVDPATDELENRLVERKRRI